MKSIAIIQPVYLPWLGYFEQIAYADHFVFYDDVQFSAQNWRNRNQILSKNGPFWLTVPIQRLPFGALIKDIKINNSTAWAKKHLRSIENSYRRAPYFEECFPILEDILERKWQWLTDLDIALIKALSAQLSIEPTWSLASDVKSDPDFVNQAPTRGRDQAISGRNFRIIEVCRAFDADVFYVGARARDYVEVQQFAKHGIEVAFQDYRHPDYPQLTREPHSHMSAIDLIMNAGPASRRILLSSPPPAFASRSVAV